MAAILGGLGFWLWRRRRKGARAAALQGKEWESTPTKSEGPPYEALSTPRYEAEANSRSELEGPSSNKSLAVAELPANNDDQLPRALAGR